MLIYKVNQSPLHTPKDTKSHREWAALFTKVLFYTATFHILEERRFFSPSQILVVLADLVNSFPAQRTWKRILIHNNEVPHFVQKITSCLLWGWVCTILDQIWVSFLRIHTVPCLILPTQSNFTVEGHGCGRKQLCQQLKSSPIRPTNIRLGNLNS